MKLTICDVCYNELGIMSRATIRASIKQNGFRIALDLCQAHRDVLKGMSYEQARKYTDDLYNKGLKNIQKQSETG